jgi:hypothetical protein
MAAPDARRIASIDRQLPVEGGRMTAIVAHADSHGLGLELALTRGDLLPGTLATGRVSMVARGGMSIRGVQVVLRATERWQHDVYDAATKTTRTVTETEQVARVPVAISGPLVLAPGGAVELPIEIPVPPLGPATLEAEVAGLAWEIELEVDRPGGLDPGLVAPVRVLQPTALLRAGVVHVGEFALYEAADSAVGEASATVEIKPMPICVGQRLDGHLAIEIHRPIDVQEIRLEVRAAVEATVGGGRSEEITLVRSTISGPAHLEPGGYEQPFAAEMPPTCVPTIELPHGSAQAVCHLILARRMARDPHLIRDVTICSTTEI